MIRNISYIFAFLIFLLSPFAAADDRVSTIGAHTVSATLTDVVGSAAAQVYEEVMPIDETIEWDIYVPANYDAATPPGVLVYISPDDSGKVPQRWTALLGDQNLIWVGANNSGNKINTHRRMTYALMALAVAQKRYKIDLDRAYLSGFSGGGRVASLLAVEYPALFKGAIYNSGANLWNKKTPLDLEPLKANRYVFIAGKNDFNLDDTQRVYRAYKKAGIDQVKLMVIPFMGHSNPKKKHYERAIMFLDQRNKE